MLCVVIAKKKLEEVRNLMEKIVNLKEELIGAVEFRFDYLNPDEFNKLSNFSEEIKRYKSIVKIGTCMLKEEGGNFNGNNEERIKILKEAAKFCDYLTIELQSFQNPETINAFLDTNLILSYHNFSKCPDIKEIKEIIKRMDEIIQYRKNLARQTKKLKDIKKIAVKFNSFEDNYKILPFLAEKKSKNCIFLGMGKYGKLTRILNHYFGFLSYVSIEEKTADGQLDINEFREILKFLKI